MFQITLVRCDNLAINPKPNGSRFTGCVDFMGVNDVAITFANCFYNTRFILNIPCEKKIGRCRMNSPIPQRLSLWGTLKIALPILGVIGTVAMGFYLKTINIDS